MNENVSIPPKVFAYYFPNYHVDPVNEDRYGAGWTEWEILRGARPRFPGHYQPRVPARGYENEADPIVAAEYVSMARAHGIDGFIFDYYWYQGRPYLQGALEDGFMNSVNFENIEFSLMWANHDWVELFPSADPTTTPPELASGGVAIEQFVEFTQYVIDRYFVRENYTRVSGKPRFSIYEPARFVKGMGGLKQA